MQKRMKETQSKIIEFSPVHPGTNQAEACPIRDVLDRIGDRWSLLVLVTLAKGTLRFSVLKRGIGDISQRMLAQTLRTLECDGYVSREVYPSVPVRVEYSLTTLGRSLLETLEPVVVWATENHKQIKKCRKAYTPLPAQKTL